MGLILRKRGPSTITGALDASQHASASPRRYSGPMLIPLLTLTALAAPDPARMLRDDRRVTTGPIDATAALGLWVWRNLVSPGDGARCPMRPTCSLYSRQAMGRDGLVGGVVLTFDRLLRDSNLDGYDRAPDGLHALDPLADHPPASELLSGGYCRRRHADGAACL